MDMVDTGEGRRGLPCLQMKMRNRHQDPTLTMAGATAPTTVPTMDMDMVDTGEGRRDPHWQSLWLLRNPGLTPVLMLILTMATMAMVDMATVATTAPTPTPPTTGPTARTGEDGGADRLAWVR